jgi:hypothetical protein
MEAVESENSRRCINFSPGVTGITGLFWNSRYSAA